MAEARHRAAVLGSPIAHSLSPLLHTAAYAALGMDDWSYDRRETTADELEGVLLGADSHIAGYSATMPLKEELVRLAAVHGWDVDETAALTGVANTWVGGSRPRILNTDVQGIVGALAEAGIQPGRVAIVGTGATARSAALAARLAGGRDFAVYGRNPRRTSALADFLHSLGAAEVTTEPIAQLQPGAADLVISTLPAGVLTADTWHWPARLPESTAVLDVAYATGSLDLTGMFTERGARGLAGTRMLVHQAVAQFQAFREAAGLPAGDATAIRTAMDAAGARRTA
jgi:shikimate dehydrogenase